MSGLPPVAPPLPSSLAERPLRSAAEERVAAWLRAVVAGERVDLGLLDEHTARVIRGARLGVLARTYGAVHETLRDAESRQFAAVTLTAASIDTVRAALGAAGVPVAVLKGLPFGERYWGDACLRPSSDVDLLVAPADYRRALAVLGDLGMSPREGWVPGWYLKRWFYHETLDGTDHPRVSVELHWDYVRPGLGDTDVPGLLAAIEPVTVAGKDLPAPAPPWQLLVAAAHAVHEFFSARHLLDVALVARTLDAAMWRAAVDLAAAARLGPTLWYGVRASAEWLRWDPPRELDRLRPSAPRDAVVARYVRRLPPLGGASRLDLQAQHVLAPALSSDGARAVTRIPYALLTDRGKLAMRIERARLRALRAVGRVGRPPR